MWEVQRMTEESRAVEKHTGLLAWTVLVNEKRYCSYIAQSINRLLWVSQLCPRTREQKPSSGVTYNDVGVISPVSKRRERVIA